MLIQTYVYISMRVKHIEKEGLNSLTVWAFQTPIIFDGRKTTMVAMMVCSYTYMHTYARMYTHL